MKVSAGRSGPGQAAHHELKGGRASIDIDRLRSIAVRREARPIADGGLRNAEWKTGRGEGGTRRRGNRPIADGGMRNRGGGGGDATRRGGDGVRGRGRNAGRTPLRIPERGAGYPGGGGRRGGEGATER